MSTVAIFGATSAIAQAVARLYAADGARFFLVARHEVRIATVAADLAEQRRNRVLLPRRGNHALILEEPPPPVHEVPAADAVQGIEHLLERDGLANAHR